MKTMRFHREINLFALAVSFFTRLPVPGGLDFSQSHLNRASRYFTLVGWLVGILVAGVFWLMMEAGLPITVALVLSMVASLMITGAFHEDGLADTADGLGGGWTPEQKLSIMKDSRLGTYGAAALWCALFLKYVLLLELAEVGRGALVITGLLMAHPLSRAVSTLMISALPYVTQAAHSKVKPLAESQTRADLMISMVVASSALLLLPGVSPLMVLALFLTGWGMKTLMQRQIGGFTGDTLGATQQVAELVVYLVILLGQGGNA